MREPELLGSLSARARADAFHHELKAISRILPRALVGPRTLTVLQVASALAAKRSAKDIEVETLGSISVRVHRPVARDGGALPAMLWIHGGGYVVGMAAQDDAPCRYFAEKLGIVVAAVEYRLAPKARFPVPLHDCYDALCWLARQSYVDPTRVAVGGASAGGGLAAALAILAHERREVRPVFQLLCYPMLDDRTATRTDIDETNFRVWNGVANRFGWTSYTGHRPGSSEISSLAAPARCEDLTGLPPAWIGVGTLDLFYEEDLAYANRLREAGVGCELETVDGAFHGFDMVLPGAGISREFRSAQAAALSAALLR